MHFFAVTFRLLYLILCLSFIDEAFASDQQRKVTFIIDGSNSMWGQIDGVNKIVIVRDALKEKTPILTDKINPALFAYGHKKKENCNDIGQLLEYADESSSLTEHYEQLVKKTYRINPKGKTPIVRAIQKVLKTYNDTQKTYDIVLIVDGKDNCGGDVEKMADTIRDDYNNIRIHVIAFDMSKNDSGDLAKLSQKTKGVFYNPNTKDDFTKAIEKLFQFLASGKINQQYHTSESENNESQTLITIIPDDSVSSSQNLRQLHLKARLTENGATLGKGVKWEIATEDPNNVSQRKTIKNIEQSIVYLGGLNLGEYYIIAHYGHAYGYTKIDITQENQQQTQEINLTLNAGGIRVLAYVANTKDAIENDLTLKLTKDGDENQPNTQTYTIAPSLNNEIYRFNEGRYKLTGRYGDVNAIVEGYVDIKKGKLSEININFRTGRIIFRLVTKTGKRILNNIKWDFFDNLGNKILKTQEASPNHIFNAGQYNIEVHYENKKYKSTFNVVPLQNKIVEVVIE